MKVATLYKFGELLRLEERPEPKPEAGGIVLRVLAAGVCHTDLHIIDGAIPQIALPLVLGHEIAGETEEFGSVLVYPCWGCGRCRHYQSGQEQLCLNGSAPGWTRDGGYAEYLAVPSQRYLLPLQGLDPIRAAPLADAGMTPYRAVRRALHWLNRGGNFMVIGAGGLGQFAIQYLKLLAPIVSVSVVDIDIAKRERAMELGASVAMTPDEVTATSDVVLDFVGTTASLALAARVVERRGLVMQVGEGGGRLPFGIGATEQEATFTTSIWGSLEDLQAVLELAHSGKIVWDVEEFPLEEANAVLGRLAQGRISGRAILRP
jgi:alcohol dehydrogenase, propanol-preferring